MESVAAFTDTYLPTINGVTYTVKTWRDRWAQRGGRMSVIYPGSPDHAPAANEYPVRSLPFPFYPGFRAGVPTVPDDVSRSTFDVVHAHTPFALGIAARRFASKRDLPIVASYHTPTAEYARYLAERPLLQNAVRSVASSYERRFFAGFDAVIVPSEATRAVLRKALAPVDSPPPVHVVSNGVDTDRFAPVDLKTETAFRERYGLGEGTLVGYTGRHGHEKNLPEILAAMDGYGGQSDGGQPERDDPPAGDDSSSNDGPPSLVIAGDGPARESLEAEADRRGLDVTFLGFLPREELPAFYSSLAAFLFPSPVETQGLVALEANACGTPVVGVDAGALTETVIEGVTGYRYRQGDTEAFRRAISRTLAERESLRESCLDRREEIGVASAIDELERVYASVQKTA